MSLPVLYLSFWAIAPPLLACLWYVLASGWSIIVYGGDVPASSTHRRRVVFKFVIVGIYVIGLIVGLVRGGTFLAAALPCFAGVGR